jgi:hypothetical protein
LPDFTLDISKEDYEKAGSKFIQVPAGSKLGTVFYRKIETQMLDWDTVGKSMKLPTVVTEGIDKGHEEKISFGVDSTGIWKGKAIYKALTGDEMPMKKGNDGKMHPVISSEKLVGKQATGVWVMVENKTATASTMPTYPKLQDIYPADYKPEANEGLGL